jgi:putative Ca2+/H+ antiporter (TMEM165/GDT1 family)
MIVTVTFFLAELGDKTMLTTVTLASQYSAVQVWLGSTLGMVLSDALAIWVGQALGKRLPERAVKIGAAAIFLAFGFFSIYQGAFQLLRT